MVAYHQHRDGHEARSLSLGQARCGCSRSGVNCLLIWPSKVVGTGALRIMDGMVRLGWCNSGGEGRGQLQAEVEAPRDQGRLPVTCRAGSCYGQRGRGVAGGPGVLVWELPVLWLV